MLIWMSIYDAELELETILKDLVWNKSTNNYNMIICLYVYNLFIYGNYMKKSIYDTKRCRYYHSYQNCENSEG